MLNDGFKLNNLGLKLMNVIFLVDGLWDFDFIMLWWSWEEFVVLYDFGGEFGFEMLLGLFEGGDLLVEVGDLVFWEGEVFESFFVVNFVFRFILIISIFFSMSITFFTSRTTWEPCFWRICWKCYLTCMLWYGMISPPRFSFSLLFFEKLYNNNIITPNC